MKQQAKNESFGLKIRTIKQACKRFGDVSFFVLMFLGSGIVLLPMILTESLAIALGVEHYLDPFYER